MKHARVKGKPVFYYGAPEPQGISLRPDIHWKQMKVTSVWARPDHQTFKIGPIAELLKRYVPKRYAYDWADPFCGDNSPAWWRNDHNPERGNPGAWHMEALKFAEYLKKQYAGQDHKLQGVLFDPPYSFRQISEHYKVLGQKATSLNTSMAFYERVKSALCDLVDRGGIVISFGWNTNGFGRARGFEIIEVLIVAHGGSKNDTIVTVEKKI